MSVDVEIVREAQKLWEQRGLTRPSESTRIARTLRPEVASPGAWLTTVRKAHRQFVQSMPLDGALKRKHVDAFFARLATATAAPLARPMEPESSQAA